MAINNIIQIQFNVWQNYSKCTIIGRKKITQGTKYTSNLPQFDETSSICCWEIRNPNARKDNEKMKCSYQRKAK